MSHRSLRAAALACTLLASFLAPALAPAGPISGYPAASTPLSGAETMIGTQAGATVQITAQSIDNILLAATSTWTGVQTFPAPGASKGSIVLTPGAVSGTPANGSLWTTSSGVFAQINGATQGPFLQTVTPVGSSGALQFNNGGALGGANTAIYCAT